MMTNAKRQDRISRMQRMAPPSPTPAAEITYHNESNGLLLADLEQRWSASRTLTRDLIEKAGLPWGGRRIGIIYSWQSIFKLEGLTYELAKHASPQANPDLYQDLLCTKAAASHLYKHLGQYRSSSSVRKLIKAGTIPVDTFITLGSRGMYRFRPQAFQQVCMTLMQGRLV